MVKVLKASRTAVLVCQGRAAPYRRHRLALPIHHRRSLGNSRVLVADRP